MLYFFPIIESIINKSNQTNCLINNKTIYIYIYIDKYYIIIFLNLVFICLVSSNQITLLYYYYYYYYHNNYRRIK